MKSFWMEQLPLHSFQFSRDNHHCAIISTLLLCRAIRQVESHAACRRCSRLWGWGGTAVKLTLMKCQRRHHLALCSIILTQLPACLRCFWNSCVSMFVHSQVLIHTHLHTEWNPSAVHSLIILWVSNSFLFKAAGITAAWQSFQTNKALPLCNALHIAFKKNQNRQKPPIAL